MFYFHSKEIEMEPNKITRLYANAAKNLSRSWLGAGPFIFAASQNLLGAAGAGGGGGPGCAAIRRGDAGRLRHHERGSARRISSALRGSSSRPSIPLVGGRARCG